MNTKPAPFKTSSLRHRIPALFALLALLLPMVSLSADSQDPESFVTVFGAIEPEFDPHRSIYANEAQIFTALYEGLFSYDASGLEPLPAAAASFRKSRDGLVYTFELRSDASWSDGRKLSSGDFANAWLRLLRDNAQYAAFFDVVKGARDFRLGKTRDAASVGISTQGEETLVVTLERPVAYFTRLLCHHAFSPIHPSMLEASAWETRIPYPVNGPWRFVSYDGSRLELEKNKAYWDAKNVSIPRLTMRFTDDDALASRLFNNEEAHWLAGPGDYDTLLMEEAIQVNPIYSTHYWYFDCRTAPWDNSDLRRALALLLPWKDIRNTANYMIPAETLVLPLPGYSKTKGIEAQDRDEAMRLLEKAGFPGGNGLPPLKIAFAEGRDTRRLAGIFQTAWKVLPELEVVLEPLSPSAYYDAITGDGKPQGLTLAHTTWIGDFADPEAFLQMWTPESPLNEAGFSDPEFTSLMEKSYGSEGQARLDLLAEAESLLLKTAAVLPIYHSFAASVIDVDYIEGWYQNALDIHPYKALRFGIPSIRPNVASLRSLADSFARVER
jgi:peptide/nickel transport system substrate-binding protein/oligopeptide transport system substrate-binding protein